MKESDFEKMDATLLQATRAWRSADIPKGVLSSFSSDVAAQIRERSIRKAPPAAFRLRLALPVLAPAMAVLVLGLYAVLRTPAAGIQLPVSPAAVQLASNTEADLDEEIALLKAIGEWTEEDETAAGMASDDAVAGMEISGLSNGLGRLA